MADNTSKKYNYQYDSSARAYAAEPLRQPLPTKEPDKKGKTNTRKKIDRTLVTQLTLCGITIFASSFIYIHSYASLRTSQNELIKLKNGIIQIKSDINEVEAQIASQLNLDNISERAKNELGMKEPLPHQIIYFELPEESYTSYERYKRR